MKIYASLMAADYLHIADEIDKLKDVDGFHLDVMDLHFVPNLTFGPDFCKAVCKYTKKETAVHLMLEHPHDILDKFSDADLIFVHTEIKDVDKAIEKIKELGCSAGLSIKPKTPLSALEPYLQDINAVLVMTVEPGFGGQEFDTSVVPKFDELRELQTRYNFDVHADGGINDKTIKDVDADIAVSGSFLFKAKKKEKAIDALRHH